MSNGDYDQNLEANALLEIWEWCSRRLHVKWQRKRRLRNHCFIGIAVALSDDTPITSYQLLKKYKSLPRPLLDRDKVLTFWEVEPMSLLELCLGSYTKASPLTKPLNRLRSTYQGNPTLDELTKKMRGREKRFGSEWFSEGHHPDREVRLFKKEMRPLCTQLRDFIANEHVAVEKLADKVLALGWQSGEIPVACLVRRTPGKLLNRANRLKLWQAAQEILSRDIEDEDQLEETLWDVLPRKITPSIKAAIEAQGYSVCQVVADFLNFDLYKSREEITA